MQNNEAAQVMIIVNIRIIYKIIKQINKLFLFILLQNRL